MRNYLLNTAKAKNVESIAVVGNAEAIFSSSRGQLIDQCEAVIRMNNAYIKKPLAQGSRCDIHAFSTWQALRKPIPFPQAKHRMWMSPKFRSGPMGPDMSFYPLDYWKALQEKLGARPSVGAMVIDYLAQKDVVGVLIFGFDFKATPTFYNKNHSHGPHDFGAEASFVMDTVNRKGWSFYT